MMNPDTPEAELDEILDHLIGVYLSKVDKPRNNSELEAYNKKVATIHAAASRKLLSWHDAQVAEARKDEVNNIVKDEYFHPSGRHMGAVRYHVQRFKELNGLTPNTNNEKEK